MISMKIRNAKKSDLKAITEIFIEEYGKPPYYEKWKQKDAKKVIEKNFKTAKIFVAELNKEPVGFIIASLRLWDDGMHGVINEFVVSNKFQRKGIGSSLFKKAEEYVKKKKAIKLDMWANNKSKAAKLYKKFGYKPVPDFDTYSKKI